MTNSIAEVAEADVILVIGSNTTENHPIIGQKIKDAVRRGQTKLIVADPRGIELTDFATLWLRQKPGTDLALINGLLHVIVEEDLIDHEFIANRTEGFEDVRQTVQSYTPEYVSQITGIPAADIVKAARLYAAGKGAIYYAMGITQHISGTNNVLGLANLAMATGNVGKKGTGINPLRGQNNVQGACDMGGLPNVYTAYQSVSDAQARRKFAAAWGCDLPPQPGLTLVEMIKAADQGLLKALYLVGENPVVSDPDISHVEEALKKVDFVVVQDIFLHESAFYADVVLPAAAFAEKEGTFTNTERRVQYFEAAVPPPGEARPDWRITRDLARAIDAPWNYAGPEEVFREIAALTPSYAGITYQRLGEEGLQWPCPAPDHAGTVYLHAEKFTRGLGKFHPVEFKPPLEQTDEEFNVILTTGRLHYHYHATISRRSRGLEEVSPEPLVELNPQDAGRMKVGDGDWLLLTSRHGEVKVKAQVTSRVAPGVVFLNFHFAEARVNRLIGSELDPVAKIPEYKAGAVRVRKAE